MTACIALVFLSPSAALAQPPSRRVSGSLVYWDQDKGFDAIVAHAAAFTEISPFWYYADPDAQAHPYLTAAGTTCESPAILSFLRTHGILVIPTIANIRDGQWNGPMVSRLLRDPALRAAHVDALVSLAVGRGYDGIDIDYEDLAASDRDAFSAFIETLASALHDAGRLLTVNVYAKTSEPGTWGGPMAQDWARLGAAADELRLMTYEYHWSRSEAGPIAPVAWVRDVLAQAAATIPAAKIVYGLPFYGYDWVGTSGMAEVWDTVMASAQAHAAAVRWDADSGSPWFEYVAAGARHTVWFENARSVESKLRLADSSHVGGVMLWRLAGEDPSVWPAIRRFAQPAVLASAAR